MTERPIADTSVRSAASTLRGGAEMGALMRRVDWAATPLGPVEAWPQSLRTAVSILLESKFPMYLAWGRDYVQLYNDGYRPILGSTKHPAAMGRRASETFAESWHIIGPMFDGVRAGDAVGAEDWMLPLDRHGYLEECYFTFSYSPIRDERDEVGGVLVTVTETTGRVLGARRLEVLHDLACATAQAASDVAACRLAGEALAAHAADVPFAAIYLRDDGASLRLVGHAHLAPGGAAAPETLDPRASSPWPVAEALAAGKSVLVDDVPRRVGALPAGPWPEPVERALVCPIPDPATGRPCGVLLAGVSPRRALDAEHQRFFTLLCGHVATAVTNARALDAERRRAAALAEVDRAKTAFFSNVSHEFRTPLTLLLGPLEDALAATPPSLHGEALASARRNAERLLRLVNMLLDFSRIEAGRARASYEPTDLAALTADVCEVFRAAIERAGLAFEVSCPALPSPVWVDRDHWEKVVLNLLSNALKFTFTGSIRVALDVDDGRARLVVADTGVGVAPEELPHVFERFHRVAGVRARSHEGSGIGLALVAELVRMHGGDVSVESAVDVGTAFTVRVPFGRAHLPADFVTVTDAPPAASPAASAWVHEALRWQHDAPPAEAAATTARDADVRILLADDNPDMRAYVGALLREAWTVEAVGDGASALAAARRRCPDLVLADVMMPGLDGLGLLRALREDPATCAVPVLMLSARAGEEARVEGLAAGADDYLVKPFSARELVARVSTHVALGRARREARAANDRLRALFAQAPLAISVVRGPEFRFEIANPRYEAMVGRAGLVGRTFREAYPELDDDAPVLAMLRRIRETGEGFTASEFRVALDRRGDGALEDAYFLFTSQPIREVDGAVDTILTAAVDVTEQVALRTRVERLLAERGELLEKERLARRDAEAASRAKDEFLAILGHELRNPLAPIVTALQLMRLQGETAAVRERTIIERQVAHVVRLVDDLLDVSRVARGKVVLHRERVELSVVVAQALETAAPLLEERRHRLDVRVPARGLSVDGDRTRLAQIASNLLTNAAKYTEPGGAVTVTGSREGDDVVLRVRDDGIGIGADVLPRVFDLFVQAPQESDRARGGLGLGLTIVRSLTELHGGSVAAESDGPTRGSTFTVRLPAAEANAPSDPGDAPPPRPGARDASAPRVLVVDDNLDAAEMLSLALDALGYAVEIAHDGPSALAALARVAPDLAVLDIGLPVMDGYELARRIRADPRFASLPMLALTGYGHESDVHRAAEAGFSQHLVKPVDLATLKRVLATLLAPAELDAAPRAG